VRLVPAHSLDAADLVRVQEIYEDGFAPRLRAPFADLLADRAYVLVDSSPLGLAVVRELGDTRWMFLRYFVVGSRGGGLGGRMWALLRSALGAAVVFDVEDPDEHGISAEEEVVRRRRITFYTRLGAQLLPVRGYSPPHGDSSDPMLLMATDLTDVRGTVQAVYQHRYGLDEDHPIVERTLRLSGLAVPNGHELAGGARKSPR
jgi:hypothetical protein